MPLDAVCLRAVVQELTPALIGLRIDKVQQPSRDQIVLLLRGNLRVLLSANPNQPRIQLTGVSRENPAEPPMFCMLLRKHLVGARITGIEQPGLERIVTLTLTNTNELGEFGTRKLVLEAMGRRSNLILLDGENRILDCLRRVELEVSAQRVLLPGLFYQPPAPIEKLSVLSAPEEVLALAAQGGAQDERVEQFLLDHFLGLSPLICRELTLRAFGSTDVRFPVPDTEPLCCVLRDYIQTVRSGGCSATMLLREEKPVDFSYLPITQYGSRMQQRSFATFSELLDAFYAERERLELAQRHSRELTRTVRSAYERTVRKLGMLEKEYAATQGRDTYRLSGELIIANLYCLERGMTHAKLPNYYDPDGGTLDVTLDPLLTPQQNAAKYYKRYQKAKTAEFHLSEQMEKARIERDYLESVQQEITLCASDADFAEIRRELVETGYLRRNGREKKEKLRPSAPWEFRTTGGLTVLVGRSNTQNDQLTLKKADRRDIWLHTQRIHGSHVILCTENGAYDEESLTQAAKLAAFFSQARDSSNVSVDYTSVRYVKKPAGAKPGMVTYSPYRTLTVSPDAELAETLKKR